MTDPGDTLAAVLLHDPARARLLDRLGLDYCCGGDAALRDACARAGLDVDSVVAQLDAAARAGATAGERHDRCDAMKPAELLRHLVDVHHSYLHAELPDLEHLAAKVLEVHGARHPELDAVRALVAALEADLVPHLQKEERILFPAIIELLSGPARFGFGAIANPIRAMTAEHEHVGALFEQLRSVTHDYAVPADACASYRSLYERLAELEHDTHLHVFEENHLLFPQVVALEAADG